ncbi:TonB-dependent receptor domain-containing protein [Telmatospirillum sp.]|uniref:TonB-dependent receptor domain-containing protein n=1 Tax=Telmatospirillum sp. TaxID=2079197 RepID=UPI00284E36FC|nr:TonB-dependent receptor [Telmatospirillum sp.]MDR3438367.1 TonB-dependent receptor [Telmatospirillum sp.]
MVVKSYGLSGRLTSGLTLTAAVALMWQFAGVTPAAAAQSGGVETVEITGSRIKNANIEGANPVATVTADDIAATKATTVEEILSHMGVVQATASSADNNAGNGVSLLGLRNLGATRTLVLVNGQRFVATDYQQPFTAVDMNAIPVSMIERIDVLKDGASSVYGADAIGGVVNIITKKNASGTTAESYIGGAGKGDGFTWGLNSTMGANFDRGNVLVEVGTDHRDEIKQSSREWAKSQYFGTAAEGAAGMPYSGYTPVPTSGNTAYLGNGQTVDLRNPSSTKLIPDTVYIPALGKSKYDLTTYPYLQGSLDRKQLNMTGHYDLTDNITAIVEGFYTDRTSREQLNPQPLGPGVTTTFYPGLYIPASNPYNKTGSDVGVNWRPVQVGPRIYNDEVETYRGRFGLAGTVLDKYDWETGYVYGKSSATYTVDNEINYLHLGQLTGQYPCNGEVGCSQANFFNGANTLTPSQAGYLRYKDTRTSELTQRFAYGNIGGPIFNLPAGPVKASIGAERRTESEWDHPDSIDVAGQGFVDVQPTSGSYSVTSGYGELAVPILKNLPGIKDLSSSLSLRDDDYSNFGQRITWKGGLNYQITEDIRLRTSYSKAIRAPSVKELYGGANQGYYGYSGDPCDNGGAFAGSATCVAALKKVGVNPANWQSANNAAGVSQIVGTGGGNPELKPETAHTFSLGTVLTPRFIPHLSASADYYSVHIKDAILDGGFAGTYTDQFLANCYGPLQSAAACNGITRAATTGDISNIASLNSNFGYERVQGIDYNIAYDFKASDIGVPTSGVFRIDTQIAFELSHIVEMADGTANKLQGTYNNNTADPRLKGVIGLDYNQDDWSAHWDTRYIGGSKNLSNPSTAYGSEVHEVWYHDISATYNLTGLDHVKNVKFTVGIDNLFDRDPPFVINSASSSNSLTDAGYDYVGRFFYMRVSAGF